MISLDTFDSMLHLSVRTLRVTSLLNTSYSEL